MTPSIPRRIRRLRAQRAAYGVAYAFGGASLGLLIALLLLVAFRVIGGAP